jgi:hypothetical protein
MRTFRAALVLAPLTLLIGLGAAILVHGGWQAVAAALSIMGGVGCAIAFAAFGAAGERPRQGRPVWAEPAPPTRAPKERLGRPMAARERPSAAPAGLPGASQTA